MVKIIYQGDLSPCSIKVYGATFKNWKTNEVRNIGEHEAEKLVRDNINFKVYKETAVETKEEIKIKPKQYKKEMNALLLD